MRCKQVFDLLGYETFKFKTGRTPLKNGLIRQKNAEHSALGEMPERMDLAPLYIFPPLEDNNPKQLKFPAKSSVKSSKIRLK